jgi:UDP-N-acetylmuramoylalanine-D-glutamate ligase
LNKSTILVFGETGATGAECVKRALAYGMKVRVFDTNPDSRFNEEQRAAAYFFISVYTYHLFSLLIFLLETFVR